MCPSGVHPNTRTRYDKKTTIQCILSHSCITISCVVRKRQAHPGLLLHLFGFRCSAAAVALILATRATNSLPLCRHWPRLGRQPRRSRGKREACFLFGILFLCFGLIRIFRHRFRWIRQRREALCLDMKERRGGRGDIIEFENPRDVSGMCCPSNVPLRFSLSTSRALRCFPSFNTTTCGASSSTSSSPLPGSSEGRSGMGGRRGMGGRPEPSSSNSGLSSLSSSGIPETRL